MTWGQESRNSTTTISEFLRDCIQHRTSLINDVWCMRKCLQNCELFFFLLLYSDLLKIINHQELRIKPEKRLRAGVLQLWPLRQELRMTYQ